MILQVSRKITNWLSNSGAIAESDRLIYEYGVFCVLFNLFPIALALIIGCFFHIPVESLLFIFPFWIIRKFCGGFHFKSPVVCTFVSTALFAFFLFGIRLVIQLSLYWTITVCVLVALIPIFAFSPIDSENRRLTQKEKKVFRKVAITLATGFALVYFVFLMLQHYTIAVPIGASLVFTALLQLPCLFVSLNQNHQ